MNCDKEVRMPIRNQGFTLYELLVTLLLVALIGGLATPYLSAIMAR